MNKITLVSLSYNHEKFIEQAIESFLNQKVESSYSIVIADDCSTDGTIDILKQYANRYPDIVKPIFREKNIGVLNNYLDAFASVKSEYVAYCECDDYFTDQYKLQKQIDFLDAHPECSMCFHRAKFFFDDNSKKTIVFPGKDMVNKPIFTIDDLLKENFIPANSSVYRWRFNDENIHDIFPKDIMPADYYMHFLHAKKGKIGFIDEVMTAYRRHKNGIWFDEKSIFQKYGESRIKFFLNVWENFANKSKEFYEQQVLLNTELLIDYLRDNKQTANNVYLRLACDIIVLNKRKSCDIVVLNKRKSRKKLLILAIIAFIVIIVLILIGFYKS